MKVEQWLIERVKQDDPNIELEMLYTDAFKFGGRYVMDLLEEYHKEQLALLRVSGSLPDYELQFCDKCYQMTNHLDGICKKCKGNDR